MIPRLSARPGARGRKDQEHEEAADVFRRFFHVLERLDAAALRAIAEAIAGGAPETKANGRRRRKVTPKRGRAAE